MKYELYYLINYSLIVDIAIILKTVNVVSSGKKEGGSRHSFREPDVVKHLTTHAGRSHK